jgi:hypothetical protein
MAKAIFGTAEVMFGTAEVVGGIVIELQPTEPIF